MVSWAYPRRRPNTHFLESRGAAHRATGGPGQSDADNGLPLSSSATAGPEYAPQPSLVVPPSPTTEVLGYQRGPQGHLHQLHGWCQVYSCLRMPCLRLEGRSQTAIPPSQLPKSSHAPGLVQSRKEHSGCWPLCCAPWELQFKLSVINAFLLQSSLVFPVPSPSLA